MKILIAYDGSECADSALADLNHAGLPKTAEALVLSVADVFLPPPLDEGTDAIPMPVPEEIRRAHQRAERKLEEARLLGTAAAEKLTKYFPGWEVRHQALADSPAWAIIRTADEQQSDLVVVGAHGHSVLGGRLILGSISQRVLYEAGCSVRVARTRRKDGESPLRLLIGVDNSAYSHAAVEAVCQRDWPSGTEVRLLTVVNSVMPIIADPSQPQTVKWIEAADVENWDQVREIFQPSADRLQTYGLDAAVEIRRGNPTNELVDEAESWGADCIFLGPKGTRGVERLLLGSVSSAVAARAHCSVEVIRSPALS